MLSKSKRRRRRRRRMERGMEAYQVPEICSKGVSVRGSWGRLGPRRRLQN
jgi:hypothetical protein